MKRIVKGIKFILVYCFVSSLWNCSKNDKASSDPAFSLGLQLIDYTRGHEDLTRFAVNMANEKITSTSGVKNYFTSIPEGENAARSSLPMIQGVYDTDWAVSMVTHSRSGQRMIDFYGVDWIKSGVEWQEMPWLQSLHFLRDRDAFGNSYGLVESLDRSREKIAKAFEFAVRVAWDRDQSFYWLGHALHMIQDSFSRAHTQRTPDLRKITNLCVFGTEAPEGACTHEAPLSGEGAHPISGALLHEDRVWREDSLPCNHNPWERGWECLKPEAQRASEVSAGLLALYASVVGTGLQPAKTDGSREISDFFRKTGTWHGGYLSGSWEL